MYIILIKSERERYCECFGPFRDEADAHNHMKIHAGHNNYEVIPYKSYVDLNTVDNLNIKISKLEELIKVQQVMLKTLKVRKSLIDEVNKDYRS